MTQRKKQRSRFLIYPKKTRVRAEPGARRVGADYELSARDMREINKILEKYHDELLKYY